MLKQPFVFISYSHSREDEKIVLEFVGRLRQGGINYFIDEESIGYGENIPEKIRGALEKATHVVAFLSPGSEASQWVFFEIGIAFSRGKTIVLRLLHSKMKVPTFLINAKYMSTVEDEKKFVNHLTSEAEIRIGKLIDKDVNNQWGNIREIDSGGASLFFRNSDVLPPLRMEDLRVGDELCFQEAYTKARSRGASNIRRRADNRNPTDVQRVSGHVKGD